MNTPQIAALDIAGSEHVGYYCGRLFNLVNDPKSIKAWLRTLTPDTIVAMESTGGHGVLLAEMAVQRGLTVYVLSPRQVSCYRRSLGRRVKSDRADAKLIHDHVASNLEHLRPYVPWAEPWKSLRNLVRERCKLMNSMGAMRQSLRARGRSKQEIAAVLDSVRAHTDELTKQIRKVVMQSEEGRALLQIPGVGPIVAGAALAVLKQIPFKHKDAFVAWIGNDLVVDESGKRKNVRRISSWGDKWLRSAFFNGGRSAIRTALWKDYYQAQLEKGLTKTGAICAVARKLQRKVYGVYHEANAIALTRVDM